jgi:hypothetical protein
MILPIGTHLCDYFRLSRRNKNIEADDTLESIILNMQLIQMSSYPLVSSEVMVSLYHEQYLIFLPPSFHIPKIFFYKNFHLRKILLPAVQQDQRLLLNIHINLQHEEIEDYFYYVLNHILLNHIYQEVLIY